MKRFFRTAFIFLFIYLIARELVPWQIYKVKSESNIQTQYSKESGILSKSATKKHDFVLDPSATYKICLENFCDSTNQQQSIEVEILSENLSVGYSRYIPIYKAINLAYSIHYRTRCLVEQSGNIQELMLEHNFAAKGTLNLTGICSGKQAKILIRNSLITQLLSETRKSLAAELK